MDIIRPFTRYFALNSNEFGRLKHLGQGVTGSGLSIYRGLPNELAA